jgi:hypothetical protein
MALVKDTLATAIKVLIKASYDEPDPAKRTATIDKYADDLAAAIDTFVKSGTAGGDPVV